MYFIQRRSSIFYGVTASAAILVVWAFAALFSLLLLGGGVIANVAEFVTILPFALTLGFLTALGVSLWRFAQRSVQK